MLDFALKHIISDTEFKEDFYEVWTPKAKQVDVEVWTETNFVTSSAETKQLRNYVITMKLSNGSTASNYNARCECKWRCDQLASQVLHP